MKKRKKKNIWPMFVEQLPVPCPNPGDLFAFAPCSPLTALYSKNYYLQVK